MPISGMKQGSGKSRFAGLVLACAGIVALAAALAAPAAFVTLPQASGDQHLPPGASSSAAPGAVAPNPDATDLDNSEQKKGLAEEVGTTPELGAPGADVITPTPLHTSSRGIPTIVADTLNETEGGAPALLITLGAIAVIGVWAAFRRRRSNLRPTG